MAGVRIVPVKVAEIETFKAVQTYNVDFDRSLWVPVFMYNIEGLSEGIVVDAGLSNPGPDGLVAGAKVKGGTDLMVNEMKGLGIEPARVKTLILTHLHIDHSTNFSLFPNARIFVQRREMEYAFDPLPTQKGVYVQDSLRRLEAENVELIDGDKEIIRGVRVISVPGHTPGAQAVCVDTPAGTVAICGDSVPMYHNWFPSDERYGSPVDLPRIPPGIHTDVEQCFESMNKIDREADIIVPSHDPAVAGGRPIP